MAKLCQRLLTSITYNAEDCLHFNNCSDSVYAEIKENKEYK